MQIEIVIALLVFGSIVGGLIFYAVMRFLKGSLKIILPKTTFNWQEKITGTLELQSKKEIKGNRLFVVLVAERQVNRGKQSHWEEVYKKEITLEEHRDYMVGFFNRYNFQIEIPSRNEVEKTIPNQALQAFAKAISFLSQGGVLSWSVCANLDAQGVDLGAKQRIKII